MTRTARTGWPAHAIVAAVLVLAPAAAWAQRSAEVPSPADVWGFRPGADYELADYSQVSEYFERLADASDRVVLDTIGTSVLGRPLLLAYISSAENVQQLERWRSVSERLARARDLRPDEARRLAGEGRAVVWIDGGLHATEVAHGQMTPLLAYEVATAETEEMRRIRDDVVTLLMPNMNPDGLDIVVDWYERNLGTAYETSDLPWLYHHYTGHDDNRDWYMITQPETKAVSRVWYHEWYPQIIYNHHQTAPFPARIFLPPFADPMNPNIPALVTRGVNLIGSAMAERFTREGMPGAVSRQVYSMWWNGGARTAPYFHNMMGILTETALYEYATPGYYDPEQLDAGEPSVFYPDPWKGGWWRLRDAVDYMMTASMAVLDIGSKRRQEWLYQIYQMGRSAIEHGEAGDPFGYVLPPDAQWDEGEAVNLVNVLRRGGVEVHRATAAFEADGTPYPAGSYIVYAAQPFQAFVRDLLEPQVYPEGRDRPYDLSGWTLSIQMGVTADRIDEPFEVDARALAGMAEPPAGGVEGDAGFGYLLSHRPNASATAVNRLLQAGERAAWAGSSFEADGRSHPAGTIVVPASGERTRGRVEALARDLGLELAGIDAPPATSLYELSAPRIALYKPWTANMDEGWTRWVLEEYGFPYDTLHNADIRDGDLSAYDAVILPSQSARSILNGRAPGTVPPEYVGGLGVEGAAALKRWVEAGGTLVALDDATDFAIQQFGLPVRNATADVSSDDFFIPGSLIRLTIEQGHPLAYGMPDEAAAFFVRSRAFEIVEPASERDSAAGEQTAPEQPVDVVARYARDDLLMSGWALGERQYLGGRPAMVRADLGAGDVVLIGFRPQFRAQPRATFKLLFNPLHGATLDRLPHAEDVAAASAF